MKNLSSVLNFGSFNGTFECHNNKNTLCIKGIRAYCVSALSVPPVHVVGKKNEQYWALVNGVKI